MKTMNRKNVSRLFNSPIGRTDGTAVEQPDPGEVARGAVRRKIEAIHEIIDLGIENMEVWDE